MAITKGSFSGGSFEERSVGSPHPDDVRDSLVSGESRAKKKVTLKAPGKKPISFTPGGLHASTGTPADQPIPVAKMAAAKAGKLGPKAQKQANFAVNVLKKGQQAAAKNKKGGR